MSNPITSYTTLVSAVIDLAEDDSDELRAYLPIAIDNAENRLVREVEHQMFHYTSTVSVNPSVATISKPSGHKITKYLKYIDPSTSRNTILRFKTDDFIEEYWPQSTSVGTPRYYSDEDLTTFRIAPCVSTTATVEIKGIRRPTALTSSNTTNVIVSVAPDLLFYATMIEVAAWQRNPTMGQAYAQLYVDARDAINNEGRRARRDDGSVGYYKSPNTIQGQKE